MKYIILALVCVLIFRTELVAQQKQGAWWYFGSKAGLNFNTQPPSPDFAGQSNSFMGCASVSDANGNLLLYADGRNVYNKQHQIMPNGNGLNLPGTNGPSNVMIVKKPGSNYLYYIFSVTDLPNNSTPNFSYSIIDLRLDAGKGDVVSSAKTVLIFSSCIARRLTTAMHSNNQDIWVITRSMTGNEYYSFLITPNGISSPVVTSIGASNNGLFVGFLKASPNGELVSDGLSSGQNINTARSLQLMDFNRSTGAFSNLRTFTFSGIFRSPYGIAYSPDNSKLYLSDIRNVHQYNLHAGSFQNVLASKTTLLTDSTIWHYDMQLGLNGKIYLINAPNAHTPNVLNIDKYLSVINCPNALGNACGFQDTIIYLGRSGGINLPALNQTLFRNANFLQLTAAQPYVCIGDSVKLSAFGAGTDNFTWFPAQGIKPKNSPEIWVKPTITTTYTVLGINNCGNSDTVSITVPVVPPAFANAGPDKVICLTGGVQLGTSAQPGFTYSWNSSPFLSDTTSANPTFSASNNTASDQIYQLILTIDGPGASCGKLTDTVQVTVKPQIIANAGSPVSFCSGTTVQLNPQQFNANYTYSWSPATGLSNTNTFSPNLTLSNFSTQPDTVFYSLMASDQGCSSISQVRVIVLPEPKPVILGPASVCPGSAQIAYNIQNKHTGTNYTWGVRGGTISQTFPDSIWVNWGNTNANAQVWTLATNSFNCLSDTVFFPVIINPLLLTEKPKGLDSLCANDRLNQTYQIARAQGSTYTWGLAGGTIQSGQGSHQISINWNGPGQHKLWVQEAAQTNLAQCFGVSDTLRITVFPSPDTTLAIQGSSSVCHKTNQIYSLNGSTNSTYFWQISGGSIVSGQGSNSVNVNWQTVGLGEIKVLETLANGCVGIWRKLPVQISPVPVTTFQTLNTFCPEALERTFQVQGMPGSTFLWQITGGALIQGQGTNQATIKWDTLSTNHKYTVIEISAAGCSSGPQEVNVYFDRVEFKLLSVGLDKAEENLEMHYLMKNPPPVVPASINIFKENLQSGKWEFLGTSLLSNTIFTTPISSYLASKYYISGQNNCGQDVPSTVHRPVKLNATGNEQSGEVKLTWNSYKGWQDTVRYEIWRQLASEAQFSKLTLTTDSSITLKTGFDGFQQRYRIKAISKAGYESWSNSIGLTFENALDFPNIITPNNDGLNETFNAKTLHLYPNSSLKIFNRWGKEVYSNSNYKGDWNAKDLSDGTYYYLFQVQNGKSFKGWVEVVR